MIWHHAIDGSTAVHQNYRKDFFMGTMTNLLQRLDKLDGAIDGKYSNIPLGGTRGHVCQAEEDVKKVLADNKADLTQAKTVSAMYGNQQLTPFTCDDFSKKLKFLVDFSEKNPVTKMFQKKMGGPKTKVTEADVYAYFAVDYLIALYLTDNSNGFTGNEPLAQALATLGDVNFSTYHQFIEEFKSNGMVEATKTPVVFNNSANAIAVLKMLSQQYSVDASVLDEKPAKK